MAGRQCYSITLQEMVTCGMCHRFFHTRCLRLHLIIGFLSPVMYALCDECFLNERLIALQSKLVELNHEMQCFTQTMSYHTSEYLIYEFMDRMRRAKNVIVYNLPESRQPNEQSRMEDDRFRVIGEISSFCSVDFINVTVRRLHSYIPNRSRPLRVYLNTESDAQLVLKYGGNCRSGLRFSSDMTPMQREMVRNVSATFELQIQHGYTYRRIEYIRRTPVIVDVHQFQAQNELRTIEPVLPDEIHE